MDEISNRDYSKESIEQYFPLELFIMPYKVVLTFESVDKILKLDHLNKSPTAILCHGTIIYIILLEASTAKRFSLKWVNF